MGKEPRLPGAAPMAVHLRRGGLHAGAPLSRTPPGPCRTPSAHACHIPRTRDRLAQTGIFPLGRFIRFSVAARELWLDIGGSAACRIAGRLPGSSWGARSDAAGLRLAGFAR